MSDKNYNHFSAIEWHVPLDQLKMFEGTASKGGEWDIIRVPGGFIYTRWRNVYISGMPADSWEPCASVFVPEQIEITVDSPYDR